MQNNAHNTGNQNIIIQGVTESTITLNVNGEIQEIRKDIDTLLALLKKHEKQQVQVGEKIYNIGEIKSAEFVTIVNKIAHIIPKHLLGHPFLSDVFLGRTTELETIHQKLSTEDDLLLLVNGQGGVGKTTIASKYYHKYQNDYKYLGWILSEKSIADALLRLKNPLGLHYPEHIDKDTKVKQILAAMSNLDAPSLLVIDNANESEDLESNYQYLRQCSNFKILLTTRLSKFQQARFYPIEGLKGKDATDLFKKHYPGHQESENELLEEVIAAVGNNTLVIELLAKNLHNFNELEPEYHLTDLLRDLKKNLLALSKSKEVSTTYRAEGTGLRHEKPETIILAMYDMGDLNEAEKALLSNFAVLPAERIAYQQVKILLNSEDLKDALLSLAKKGWIEYQPKVANIDASFKISPVVQEITKVKQQGRLAEDTAGLIHILIDKLKYQPGVGHLLNVTYTEAAVYARYGESIVDNIQQLSYNLALFCERLGRYYQTTGNLNKTLDFFSETSEIFEQLHQSEPDNSDYKNGLAVSYSKLGETHAALGELDKALKFYEQQNELGKQLYAAYPNNVQFKNGLAISYAKLGVFSRDQLKDRSKARTYFEKAQALWSELAKDAPQYAQFQKHYQMIQRDIDNL